MKPDPSPPQYRTSCYQVNYQTLEIPLRRPTRGRRRSASPSVPALILQPNCPLFLKHHFKRRAFAINGGGDTCHLRLPYHHHQTSSSFAIILILIPHLARLAFTENDASLGCVPHFAAGLRDVTCRTFCVSHAKTPNFMPA